MRIAAVGIVPFRTGITVALVMMLGACAADTATSPSPSGVGSPSPATATLSPTSSPSEASTQSPDTPTATASPTSAVAPPDDWELVLTVRNEGEMLIARGVVLGTEGYLAAAEGFVGQEGGSRLESRGLWRSADGRTWEEVPSPMAADDWLQALTTTRDGDFLLITRVYDGPADISRTVVLRSSDGQTWDEIDSGLPDDLQVYSVDHGAVGSLLVAGEFPAEGNNDLAAWRSADGLRWEKVLDLDDRPGWVTVQDGGAGPEGFVVAGTVAADDNTSHEYFGFASADGRQWIAADDEPFGAIDPQFRPDPYVAPLGPDWLAFLHTRDGDVRVFRSTNGLEWSEVGFIEREGDLNVFAPLAAEIAGRVYFSTAGVGVAPASGQAGIWTSTDGAAWEPMPMGSDGYLGGIAARDGIAVAILTHLVGNGSDMEIWIGPTD